MKLIIIALSILIIGTAYKIDQTTSKNFRLIVEENREQSTQIGQNRRD